MNSKISKYDKLFLELVSDKDLPLYQSRIENHYLPVLGEGNLDSKIFLLGEAPGKNEASVGSPFCGASGKLLNEILEKNNLHRKDIFISNLIHDRPPKNRNPSKIEILKYSKYFRNLIDITQPHVIIALGSFACKSALELFSLPFENITKSNGKVYKVDKNSFGIKWVGCMFHPAVGLYNRRKIPQLIEGMNSVLQRSINSS